MFEIKEVSVNDPEYDEIQRNNFFRNPVYHDAIKNICESSGVSLYVATKHSSVCGFAAVNNATCDVCSLLSLSVAPDYRKKGIATAIIDNILADKKPKALVAECLADSLGFFENYGFYANDLGEKQPGKSAYYVTYRKL